MTERMTAEPVCDDLEMTLGRRRPPRAVNVRSDRGRQRCAASQQALLSRHGLLCSMNGKGNCDDNGGVESLFHA